MTVTYHYDSPWVVLAVVIFAALVVAFVVVPKINDRLRERRGRRLRSMSDQEFWTEFHKGQARLRRKSRR